MAEPVIAPYGSWKSPLTTDLLLAGSVALSQPLINGASVYWIEVRPLEGGRSVIVRRTGGATEDMTPPCFNARTRVHEYGGGDYTVRNGVVYFANFADQRIYRQRPGEAPQPITPEAKLRYADFVVDLARDRLICVREDHREDGREAVNTLVAVPLDGGEQHTLVRGNDFYAAPRLSPDGRRLAWLAWNHPNMPWDGTELWLADVAEDGWLSNRRLAAGGPHESIFQPEWSPDGILHFISDHSGWWNLYRLSGGDVSAGDVPAERLYPMEAEFGMAQWVFGLATYAFESPTRIICAYTRDGQAHMARLDAATKTLTPLDLPYMLKFPSYGRIVSDGESVAYLGSAAALPDAIVRVGLDSGATEVLRHSTNLAVDDGYLSIAQPIDFPTRDGLTAYGYFYSPRNRDYAAPPSELPPLVVLSHGGPTSATTGDLDMGIQYWTSRGFAILDVNYGGSTGYGRAYRERLNGNWGVVDVEDCVNGARYLAQEGLVDGERLIISGGSAGGYTTLCAITSHDVFRAAASHFGVSDVEAFAGDTHKFESRYMDNLIGPYPDRIDLYVARSPVHRAYDCTAALILFQGLEDEVVPPAQSETMFAAARSRGLPVAYVSFEGEGHGFRQAANIKRAVEGELYFYGRVFGFTPADDIEPVDIENL